jgi:hypothetical protein
MLIHEKDKPGAWEQITEVIPMVYTDGSGRTEKIAMFKHSITQDIQFYNFSQLKFIVVDKASGI